jgi:hypothetical protein
MRPPRDALMAYPKLGSVAVGIVPWIISRLLTLNIGLRKKKIRKLSFNRISATG